jgi:hypothetical protein
LAAALGSLMTAAAASGQDKKSRPAALRRFNSDTGAFQLEVTSSNNWKTSQAHAEMFALASSGRRSVWSIPLPQRYGPALAVVADTGGALLVDEWINTPSPYALMVIAPDGNTVRAHSMTDIATAAGLSPAQLAASAASGPWMSAPPVYLAVPDATLIEAGGVRLRIDLKTGKLSRVNA